MPLPSRSAALRLASLTLGAVLLTTACAPGVSPMPTTSTTPGTSGSAACPTAPAPADNLEGWGPPATAPEVLPILIAGQGPFVCGPNRVLFSILDKEERPIAAPDRTMKLSLFVLGRDPKTPISSSDGTFIWAIENERGIYVIDTTFPEAGRYGAEFTTAAAGGAPVTLRLTFDVQPSSAVIKVGDAAPASKTPTLDDVGGDPTKISTDADPDPALYETSVDQALADHEPFVVIFATPKFCLSAQCGPTLERIKPFVARYPTVTFINIEPYKLKLVDGTLAADLNADQQLQATAITQDEWHLFTEPTVYVVDRDGIVTARFDLMFSEAELTAALDAVK